MNIFLLFMLRINKLFESMSKIRFKLRYAIYRKIYKLPKSFRFNGLNILFYGDGKLNVGENSYIGRQSSIQTYTDCTVAIGSKVSMSHFVNIYTCNHQADKDFSTNDKSMRLGNVIIGDYCWIGIKSTIIGPVKIGENSVIASNSLVTRDIPPHSISMGVPAKVVKFKSYLTIEQQIELAHQFKNVISSSLLSKLHIK